MKKLFFLNLLLVTFVANSQNNIFPEPGPGNVGIGTTTPTEKLEVVGTVLAKRGLFTNSQPNGSTFIDYADRNEKCLAIGVGTRFDNTQSLFTVFDFPQSNLNPVAQSTIGLEDRSYTTRWGFNADTGGKSTLTYYNKSQSGFFILNEDGNDNVVLQMPKANTRVIIAGDNNYLPEHKFVVKNGSAMIEGNILTNSNIGIGTSSFIDGTDTYKLSVNGKIRANAVKVYTDWADFVFEDTYKLPTLEEVENYINKNGHLKNIPSAKEVEENGIELGEMNKLLLQKIEELTLYTIQLKKEIDELKAK